MPKEAPLEDSIVTDATPAPADRHSRRLVIVAFAAAEFAVLLVLAFLLKIGTRPVAAPRCSPPS